MAIEKETALTGLGVVLLVGALGVVGYLLHEPGGLRVGDGEGGVSFTPQGTTVLITGEQVQARLAPAFPLTRQGPLGLSVELSDPLVVLRPDEDRIRLTTTTKLKHPALTIGGMTLVASGSLLDGKATVSGQLVYESDEGALFFEHPKLDDLTVKGLHERLLDPAESLCTSLLKKHLARVELYRLGDTWQERAAKLFVQQITIKGGVIRIELGLPRKK